MCVCVSVPSGTDQRTKRNETKPSNQPNPTQRRKDIPRHDKKQKQQGKKILSFSLFYLHHAGKLQGMDYRINGT